MKAMIAKVTKGSNPRGAIAYVLSKGDHSHLIGGTMSGSTVAEISQEFAGVIGQRPDIKRPVWNVSLTLPEGERLTDEDWAHAARRLLERIGRDPDNILFAVVRHTDTAHDHIHIVSSRVGVDGKVWEVWQDAHRTIEAAKELEQDLGLTHVPVPEQAQERKRITNGEYWQSDRRAEDPVRFRLQALVDEALADKPTAIAFVRRLEASGVSVRPNLVSTGRLNGFSFELDGISFKGSQLGKAYGLKGLLNRGLSYVPERDAEELAKQKEITPVTPQIRSRALEVEDAYATGLTTTDLGASGTDPNEMAFRIGQDLGAVEALKESRLEPARIAMNPDRSLVVVLKADKPMGPKDREALTRAVREAVPGAELCPTPEHGMVLEAKGHKFSRTLEIERFVDQER